MRSRTTAIAFVAGLASAVSAQSFTPDSTVSLSLSMIDNGNANGILEPGEAAILTLSVSFTNQFQVGSFAPPIAGFASGTMLGFALGWMDLIGVGGTAGSWNVNPGDGFGVVPAFNVFGAQGTPSGNDLVDLEMGQVPSLPNSIVTTNPVVPIWRGLWVPQTYVSRVVSFTPAPNVNAGTHWLALMFALDQNQVAPIYVGPNNQIVTGTGLFPISPIPAPQALAVFALAAGLGGRRRTRSTGSV